MSGDPPKSMTHRYKDRKAGEEPVDYFDVVELKSILQPTYGVLVYQEQAMKIAVVLAGFNEQEADILRKAIGKKKPEIMAQVEKTFLDGCKKAKVIGDEKAQEIFGWIRESQRYSFNKSHAITYGLDSFWSAYAKAHFSLQFYCSYLRGASWKQDRYEEIKILANDAKLSGISVNCPDFRDQEKLCYQRNNELYFGLFEIRGIGDAAVDKILRHTREVVLLLDKNIEDWTWMDYLIYFSTRIPSNSTKALIQSGALDYYKVARNCMLYEFEKWELLTKKEKEWVYTHQYEQFNGTTKRSKAKWSSLVDVLEACGKTKKEGGGCHRVTRVEIIRSAVQQLRNPPHSLNDDAERIAWCETKYLGASVTTSTAVAAEGSFNANITCKELYNVKGGHYLVVAVEIVRANEHKTKKGKNPGSLMGFMTVQDDTGGLDDVKCFPDKWKLYKDMLFPTNVVLMQVDKMRGGGFSVQKVRQI
jgi:DNA polymerase III alpha subunit